MLPAKSRYCTYNLRLTSDFIKGARCSCKVGAYSVLQTAKSEVFLGAFKLPANCRIRTHRPAFFYTCPFRSVLYSSVSAAILNSQDLMAKRLQTSDSRGGTDQKS